MRILLVEDDPRMRALVRRGLSEHAHAVETAGSLVQARDALATHAFDVAVMDVMLPDGSALDLVGAVRRRGDLTPILLLTARDSPDDIAEGLDAGADDYLVKPFAFPVLLARLRALGRRRPSTAANVHRVADIVLDNAAHVVTRGGAPVSLTRTEYLLLERLIRNAGRVVTRHALLELMGTGRREVESNTLDAFVKSLRHKLDDGGRTRVIHTIRGVGYCLREEAEE
ncbi:MAG: response regulator transcription factor [Acidobacteriota bacterium]